MPLTPAHLSTLSAILPSDCVIYPSSPTYRSQTQVWAAQQDLHPSVVLRPKDLSTLQATVKYLCATPPSDLDFVVRNTGVGSASSRDVVLTVAEFNGFEFDEENEIVTLGAGQLWEDVDRCLKERHPGWAVVGARSPYVGVSGYLLVGGLSWLSHEFGLGSDPQNLLDAQVVLADGRVVWGSEEPELLWAMRGGRTAFGVVTQVKLRARRVQTTHLFSGNIVYPKSSLAEVSRKLSDFVARNDDPKLALHAFVFNPKSPFFDAPPGIGVWVYDGHGVEHGRGEAGFRWALEIDGALDMTAEVDLWQVNEMTNVGLATRGLTTGFYAAGLLPTLDAHLLVRASAWLDKVLSINDDLAAGTFVIVEVMGRRAYGSLTDSTATAFPHTAQRHVLQLGTGYKPGALSPCNDALALRMLQEAFSTIPEAPDNGDFSPTFLQPFMDFGKMYGPNLERLKGIGEKFDPMGRFKPGLW